MVHVFMDWFCLSANVYFKTKQDNKKKDKKMSCVPQQEQFPKPFTVLTNSSFPPSWRDSLSSQPIQGSHGSVHGCSMYRDSGQRLLDLVRRPQWVPHPVAFPWLRTMTSSASTTVDHLCAVEMEVLCLTTSLGTPRTVSSVMESNDEVASSQRMTGGFPSEWLLQCAPLCFSHPDSLSPHSPTCVSCPCGIQRIAS